MTLPAQQTPGVNRTRSGAGGVGCRARREEQEPEQVTKREVRPRVTARNSGGSYVPVPLSTPSLPLSQPSAGVYIPPPVNNPSAQIDQLNHSFPLNGGLGLNPTNRDAYIRYNLTR